MFGYIGTRKAVIRQRVLLVVSVVTLLGVSGCKKQESAQLQPGPRTFASPEAAGQALEMAAKSQNQSDIVQIFGPDAAAILASGDPTEEKASISNFAQSYQVMNRWRKLSDGSEMLIVGADSQTFPIPLKRNTAGEWYFDTAAGKDEILSRRIGRNEITAITVCAAIADAQAQYLAQKHDDVKQYAQKFISDENKQNGLYWPQVSGQPKSPLGPLVAFATAEGYKVQSSQHQPFYGYYFAILDKQGAGAVGGAKDYIANGKMTGGYAVVAYPAVYGDTGVMTFLFNQNGPLLQKDLGKSTDQVVAAMTEFNPDQSWTVVE